MLLVSVFAYVSAFVFVFACVRICIWRLASGQLATAANQLFFVGKQLPLITLYCAHNSSQLPATQLVIYKYKYKYRYKYNYATADQLFFVGNQPQSVPHTLCYAASEIQYIHLAKSPANQTIPIILAVKLSLKDFNNGFAALLVSTHT